MNDPKPPRFVIRLGYMLSQELTPPKGTTLMQQICQIKLIYNVGSLRTKYGRSERITRKKNKIVHKKNNKIERNITRPTNHKSFY